MKPLYEDESWEVTVEWTRPKSYETLVINGCENDEDAYLYLISARFSSSTPKGLYIGKTWNQVVSMRLNQPDHKKRYAAFVKNYPRHSFFVSHGRVHCHNAKLTEKRLADIEQILIYSNNPEYASNVRNFYAHGVKASYVINNVGHKCSLPRKISLGVFVAY